jgi:flavin reductase (DIM6/NTAB) family NADH-FMN oxidoreductase RutF
MKKSLGANTIIYPTPVWCVGSYDSDGTPNLMTAAWGGVCASHPPCLTVSLRKATYSHGNILERGAYTVNVPSADFASEADYFGTISGREVNKFQVTGLTPVQSELVDAPLVDEFPMVLECELIQHYQVGSHTLFIGEILDVKVDEKVLSSDGKADIRLVSPIIYTPGYQEYFRVGQSLGRSYHLGKKFK